MDEEELKEFSLFLKGNVEPSAAISNTVLTYVNKRLNPSILWTLIKVFLFHVFGSASTLLFCPQYGLSLIGSSQGVMPYLMKIHPAFCFVVCGIIWMVGGQVLSYFFLTLDEKRVLGNYRWGFAFGAIALSLLGFACLGSLTFDLWLGLWLVGALTIITLCNVSIGLELRHMCRRASLQF